MAQIVNLQIATFAGLGLPRTLNKPVSGSTPTCDVLSIIHGILPNKEIGPRLIVSTTDGRLLSSKSQAPISALIPDGSHILPIRLSSRLCGGKGGFGSQLRAAGGRMSSRKNKDRQNANGSNRNLDGRRLRTVDEAKKLAQYLEMKPEMEKKEKEERRKRLEAVIQAAEETEERIKAGKMGSNQGRLSAQYVEDKELAEDKVREAIARAMKDGMLQDDRTGSESSAEDEDMDSAEDPQASSSSSDESNKASAVQAAAGPSFFDWDEEDEEETDDDEQDEEVEDELHGHAVTVVEATEGSQRQLEGELSNAVHVGKGKGRQED